MQIQEIYRTLDTTTPIPSFVAHMIAFFGLAGLTTP